jgi:hypothetical protein
MNANPRRWLLLILVAYLLLAVGYGRLTPLFEAPDEHWHYFTAQYIADNRALPSVTADYDEWLSQEAAQPPLYYLVGALLISPIKAENGREALWLNPFAAIGDASEPTTSTASSTPRPKIGPGKILPSLPMFCAFSRPCWGWGRWCAFTAAADCSGPPPQKLRCWRRRWWPFCRSLPSCMPLSPTTR